jgi:mRNA-degrading endonuclease YafQ of YafQ-DinJ toxin-antitoxin module
MKFRQSKTFRRSLARLHPDLQKQAKEKFKLFVSDQHHPSLKTKKMGGKQEEIWEGHITEGCVFTFRYTEDENGNKVCEAIDIGTHAIYRDT